MSTTFRVHNPLIITLTTVSFPPISFFETDLVYSSKTSPRKRRKLPRNALVHTLVSTLRHWRFPASDEHNASYRSEDCSVWISRRSGSRYVFGKRNVRGAFHSEQPAHSSRTQWSRNHSERIRCVNESAVRIVYKFVEYLFFFIALSRYIHIQIFYEFAQIAHVSHKLTLNTL